MKFTKKMSAKIAAVCDINIFTVGKTVVALTDIETELPKTLERLNYGSLVHPRRYHPDALLTVEVLEDNDNFHERCMKYCNYCETLFCVGIKHTEDGLVGEEFTASRSALPKQATNFDKVYCFGAPAIVYTITPSKHTCEFVPLSAENALYTVYRDGWNRVEKNHSKISSNILLMRYRKRMHGCPLLFVMVSCTLAKETYHRKKC